MSFTAEQVRALQGLMDELKCPICLSMFTNPHSLPCGHQFCRECLGSALRAKGQCPMCNQPTWMRQMQRSTPMCNLVQACINLFAEFDARTEDDEPVVDATPVERLREEIAKQRVQKRKSPARAGSAAVSSAQPSSSTSTTSLQRAQRSKQAAQGSGADDDVSMDSSDSDGDAAQQPLTRRRSGRWAQRATTTARDFSTPPAEVQPAQAPTTVAAAATAASSPHSQARSTAAASADAQALDSESFIDSLRAAQETRVTRSRSSVLGHIEGIGEPASTSPPAAAVVEEEVNTQAMEQGALDIANSYRALAREYASPSVQRLMEVANRRRTRHRAAAAAATTSAGASTTQTAQAATTAASKPTARSKRTRAGASATASASSGASASSAAGSSDHRKTKRQRSGVLAAKTTNVQPDATTTNKGKEKIKGKGKGKGKAATTEPCSRPTAAAATPTQRRPRRARAASASKSSGVGAGGGAGATAADLVTAERRPPSKRGVVLIGSRLDATATRWLNRVAKMLEARIAPETTTEVTHVIMGTKPGASERHSSRTTKLLFGNASGCWVVGQAWLKSCLESKARVPEGMFEIVSDGSREGGPRRSRLRRENKEPALFHSMSFYIAEHLTSPSMSDFVFLVNTAGGKVSTSRPEPLESETSSSSSDSDSADAGAGKEVSSRPLAETVPRAVVCSTCGRLHLHHAAGCQPAQSTSRHGRAIRPPQPAHAFESTMECPACHTSTTVSEAPFGDVLVVVDGTLHKAAPAASSRLRRDAVPASVSAGRLVVSHTWLIESLSAGEQLPIQQFLR